MTRESWRSRAGFALAAAGSAIGLATIVRFPYLVGQYGGAAFIFIYLICICVIGIPVLFGEVIIGRTTQRNPYGAFSSLGKSSFWKGGGALIVLTAFIVSSFYSALSGWLCGYLVEAVTGGLQHLHTANDASELFQSLLANPYWGLSYHLIFILCSISIVIAGLRDGIERYCKILMPLLLLTLLTVVAKGLTLENASEALHFLITPDWSQITPTAILMALGGSFFSLSLGQGTMITYGSYLPKNDTFTSTCMAVVVADIGVSLLAAIGVFTIIFSVEGTPEGGLGLLFQTFPIVFSNMIGGYFIAIVFFMLALFAAITSEISALEPVVAYLVDERGWTRKQAVTVAGSAAFVVGIPCALSTSVLSGWTIGSMNILELFDFVATTILIPIGGLMGVLLVAWKWGFSKAYQELIGKSKPHPIARRYLKVCLKYLAPALIVLIFLSNLGIIQ